MTRDEETYIKREGEKISEYALDNYTINGRTFREWIQAIGDMAEAMENIKAEMRQAVDEWDYAKAAGFRRAAELIEKALNPETETTAEQIGRKERGRMILSDKGQTKFQAWTLKELMIDFVAINVAFRRLLRDKRNMSEDEINKFMTGVLFETAGDKYEIMEIKREVALRMERKEEAEPWE